MKTTNKTKNSKNISSEPNASGPMIDLCVISYSPIQNIKQEVENLNAGWDVVWGPAQLVSEFGVSYSLMYIVNDSASGETAVVIRGTNPTSIIQWMQDFDLAPMVEFSHFVPVISSDIKITNGMANALNDLLALTDPTTGQTAVDYLKENPSSVYNITGHSLGGALTPALMATLNYQLFGNTTSTMIAMYPFAAPAFGNAAFAAFIDSLYNSLPIRYCNPLDVAPYCFWDFEGFKNMYNSNGITWSSVPKDIRIVIEGLFLVGAADGLAQYGVAEELPAVFNTAYNNFLDEAMYQHHATTYQSLINNM